MPQPVLCKSEEGHETPHNFAKTIDELQNGIQFFFLWFNIYPNSPVDSFTDDTGSIRSEKAKNMNRHSNSQQFFVLRTEGCVWRSHDYLQTAI